MPENKPTPRTVAAYATMRRIRAGNLRAVENTHARRQLAASRGYRGPLTRAEYARNASHR
jgi:hypothetical protein